jgi:hypothetical protein
MNIKLILALITLSLFFVATSAQVLIPFHLVNGYILIDAEVNHVKGKFIFDTGTPLNFMINNNLVPLDKDAFVVRGAAGSGQVLDVYRSDIASIKIIQANLEFKNLQNVTHTNFSFLQDSIASDILGTFGYGIMKDYVVTIDYDRQFIKMDSDLKERPDLNKITAFHFINEGNYPEVTFTAANGRKIQAYFDTGSQGVMKYSKSLFSELSAENLLEVYSTGFLYGYAKPGFQTYSIRNLSYNSVVFDLKHLSYTPGEENKTSLGYSFLKDYISVWDFKNKVISLYKDKLSVNKKIARPAQDKKKFK